MSANAWHGTPDAASTRVAAFRNVVYERDAAQQGIRTARWRGIGGRSQEVMRFMMNEALPILELLFPDASLSF